VAAGLKLGSAAMSSRIILTALLLAASAGSPSAWSQEPPTFALHSAAIKQIVRNTAATQFGEPGIPETPANSQNVKTLEPVPREHAMSEEPPVPQPTAKERRSHDGPISALIDVLIDEALGIEDVVDVDTPHDDWLRCPPRAADLDLDVMYACPGRQSAWGLTQPLGYQSPDIRAR
jgi:hypothetical protein